MDSSKRDLFNSHSKKRFTAMDAEERTLSVVNQNAPRKTNKPHRARYLC